MDGVLTSLAAGAGWLGHALDPLCGPVGVFSFLPSDSIVACGDTGWGDEIALGLRMTLSLALATLPLGLVIGFFIALALQSREPALRRAAGIYTTIFRGLPELLTLFIVYYGAQILIQAFLAGIGYEERVEINSFVAGMVALSVVFSSYCSEVLLSAFRAIPQGQYEAGDALGLRRSHTMRLVIVPQLIRIALPGLVNLWMNLLKDTALVSVIGLAELLRQTGVAAKVSKQAFFFYLLACALYLALALVSSFALGFIERWAKRAEISR